MPVRRAVPLAAAWLGGCAEAPAPAAPVPAPPAVAPLEVAPAAPDPSAYPIWGVDVSHHQHTIDWAKVAREPRVRFANLKATEGTTHQDDRFAQNWAGARSAGLYVGAYHYYSFCTGPETQAANYLAMLPKAEEMLPPALDVEHLMNCPPDPDPEKVRADLRVWLDTVQRATGRQPIVYATSDVLADYFLDAIDVPLWVRHTPEDPEEVLHLPWTFWQYDDQHTMPGIDTTVDRDVYTGSEAELAALVRGG